ncbi:hypothetical protein U7230_07785 [Carboxydochorda subterranea]|uniref:Uncharacterized protein n=1 Tax=Carboxydichorda subterranea TaxID=3109565 RepID=A0ABZ1BV56_9FIRM|nr:hypothetical protein [Limnochorda sp. L945t]WRP16012.1 hypothetical protein U7230_07785 [Limnochorda sp. L945t]
MEEVRLTREELYRLVWSEPIQRVARRLGISDVMLAKHCRRMEVPRPGRGYWQRVAVGQHLKPAPLPPPKSPQTPTACVIRAPTQQRRETPVQKETAPEVTVQSKLNAPHPLVRSTLDALRRWTPDRDGLLRVRGAEGSLDVAVSPSSVDRAMRILDALLKAVESRGGRVLVRRHPDAWVRAGMQRADTLVEVQGQQVQFRLRELLNRRPHTPTLEEQQARARYSWAFAPMWDYTPCGRLSLEIVSYWPGNARKRWTDGARERLEECLGEVVVALEQAARAMREQQEAEERARQRQAEEERRRRLQELERQREEARRRQLAEEAERWHLARRVRAYISAVEQQAKLRGMDTGPEGALGRWIAWARSVVDELDPLKGRLAALFLPKTECSGREHHVTGQAP